LRGKDPAAAWERESASAQASPIHFWILLFDDLAKSRNSIKIVIPAKAGIQLFQDVLDPGFRRGGASRDFYEAII